jgi:hypothetical protein
VECLVDLQETSARLLVVGGRLCFWLPDFNEDAQAADGQQENTAENSERGSDSGADERPQVGSTLIEEKKD